MPPELIPSDDEYASSADSDFAPDAAPTKTSDISSDEEVDIEPSKVRTKAKGKRGGDHEEAEDAGFENSGDEAIIERGLKRKRRKGRKGQELDDDDDGGGEAGSIKTRSMREKEKLEKRPLVTTEASTIDVDAIWQSMISNKPAPNPEGRPTILKATSPRASPSPDSHESHPSTLASNIQRRSPSTLEDGPDSMIMIKRTYNFAGKVHTEQKLVPRSSAEAKLYLATQMPISDAQEPSTSNTAAHLPKRRIPKARRSIFEPVIDNMPRRTDLNFGVRRDADGLTVGFARGPGKEAKKLNTVEKSAMDWAGFVDKEGIKDELDAAGKAKGAYKARQEFLDRVEAKKSEEERRARGLV